MKAMLIILLLALGFIVGPGIHEAYVWHQIEKQALVADLAEGGQP
jgi:hypothetical protein